MDSIKWYYHRNSHFPLCTLFNTYVTKYKSTNISSEQIYLLCAYKCSLATKKLKFKSLNIDLQVLFLYSSNFIKLFGVASMITIIIMPQIWTLIVFLLLKET